jgi:hypothetical protein
MNVNDFSIDELAEKLDQGVKSGQPSVPRITPWHISPDCPQCGTRLMLSDVLEQPSIGSDDIWYDEWQCPACRDGVYMDWETKDAINIGLPNARG